MKNLLVLTLLLMTAGALAWHFTSRESSPATAAQPPAGTGQDSPQAARTERQRTASEPGAAAVIEATAEEVLRSYWGADWSAMRAKYAEQGVDLEAALALEPWDDVISRIEEQLRFTPRMESSFVESMMRWPDTLDATWLEKEFGLRGGTLDDEDVARVQDFAAQMNDEIRATAAHSVELMQRALIEALHADRVARAPLTTKVLDPQPWEEGKAFYSTAGGAGGWAVRVGITYQAYPDIAELRAQTADLVRSRNDEVRGFLRR